MSTLDDIWNDTMYDYSNGLLSREQVALKFAEALKPSTNKRYTQCPKCGGTRICFWMCHDKYGCYDCDWVEGHSA